MATKRKEMLTMKELNKFRPVFWDNLKKVQREGRLCLPARWPKEAEKAADRWLAFKEFLTEWEFPAGRRLWIGVEGNQVVLIYAKEWKNG